MSDFLNVKTVADRLGITPQALRQMISRKEGPGACKIGREWKFRPATVERYIALLEAPTLLTSAQAAAALSITLDQLDKWSYRDEGLPFIKVGKYRRYRLEDVERARVEGVDISTRRRAA